MTEQRTLLRVVLCAPKDATIPVDNHDIVPDVSRVLDDPCLSSPPFALAHASATPASASAISWLAFWDCVGGRYSTDTAIGQRGPFYQLLHLRLRPLAA
jgi:hypothetical protein